ncbi:MAG: hypothetical protein AAF330_05475 [Pseudomonadota bacterium]
MVRTYRHLSGTVRPLDAPRAGATASRTRVVEPLIALQDQARVSAVEQRLSALTAESTPREVAQLWSVKEIQEEKERLDAEGHFPGETALHHIVSRAQLSKLAAALGAALRGGVEGALDFWKAAQSAAGADIIEQAAGEPEKVLHNLPLNLSYGPASPLNDPGEGFDPDTVPGETAAWALHPISEQLKMINDTIVTIPGDVLAREEGAEHWVAMTAALKTAIKLNDTYLSIRAPIREQWLEMEGADGERRFFRRGQRALQGQERAEKFLRLPVAGAERIGLAVPADGDGDGNDENATEIYASADDVKHFLERHTYAHFTFSARDIKAVNTFWPVGTGVAAVSTYAKAALAFASAHARGLPLEREEYGDTILEYLETEFSLKNIELGLPHPVFMIFHVSRSLTDGVEDQFEVHLKALAPDGGADAYRKGDLEALREIVPVPDDGGGGEGGA